MISRRGFLLGTAAAAAAVIVPELEVPKKTIFLPPAGGWGARIEPEMVYGDGFYKRYIGYEDLMVTAPVHPKYGAQCVYLSPGSGPATVCMPTQAEIGRMVTVHNGAKHPAKILEGVTLEPGDSAMLVKVDARSWRMFKTSEMVKNLTILKPADG